jgi:hypothetical protein
MIHTAEEFVKLRTSEIFDEYNRAAREEAPIGVWREVIRQYPEMRVWVAYNKTVPIEILELLSDDEDKRVRNQVASRRKLPEYLQMKLASDTEEFVRIRIACNPKATKKVLEMLLHDSSSTVKGKATTRIEQKDYLEK